MSEFLGIKKRFLDIRENVRGAIKTTDNDIAKTALLAKGFREAGQTVANAFRTFADKPEADYSQKEQKHFITKAVLAPMKVVKKMFVLMELHLFHYFHRGKYCLCNESSEKDVCVNGAASGRFD